MSFLSSLDPTGDNFLGLGPKVGRVAAGAFTLGNSEIFRPDPFGSSRKTVFAKAVGGTIQGATTGAVVGFATGGPFGAAVGATVGGIGGGVAGVTGATNNYTPLGVLKNTGIGVGAGLTGGGAAWLSTASKVPAFIGPTLPKITLPALPKFTAAGITAGASLISALKGQILPGTSNVNLTPPDSPNAGTGTHTPQTVNVNNPSATPSAAPSAAAPSSIAVIPIGTGTAPYPWWIVAVAAGALYLYFKKKAHHR